MGGDSPKVRPAKVPDPPARRIDHDTSDKVHRKKGGYSWTSIATRCAPLVFMPVTVGVFQPRSGVAGAPHVLLALALAVVIAVSVRRPLAAALTTALSTGLLLSAAFMEQLGDAATTVNVQPLLDRQHLRGESAAVHRRYAPPSGPVELETISVVLPCAMEGEFAWRTVEAIWKNTKHDRLHEIIVVDDGGSPPLAQQFPKHLLSDHPGGPPTRILRHESTMGLITAKRSGGDQATGDVIVFFDCHVSPRVGWEEAFLRQMKRAGDHKTVVVPTITALDHKTWTEIKNGPMSKACYMMFNADFTWLNHPGRDVPLMSGGLVSISRRWWEETGGYDEHMVAWGGENIDQSLRTWLCGGRIEVAKDAYVAHMWRDPKDAKTALHYPIPTAQVMRNKARAAKAWLGPFFNKTRRFYEYENFVTGEQDVGPMDTFDRVKEKLQCKPFTFYIARFSYVYIDGGLLPREVFQLREKISGLCLERAPATSQPHAVILGPCSGAHDGANELQSWHLSNRDLKKRGGPCCSGLANWNFLQCMDAGGVGSRISTFECEISGKGANQVIAHDPQDGQIYWRPGQPGEGCVAPQENRRADAVIKDIRKQHCGARVVPFGDSFVDVDGQRVPASFTIESDEGVQDGVQSCAVPLTVIQEGGAGWALQFVKCDQSESGQVFHAKPLLSGVVVTAGDTGLCLDSASGLQLLVYPCYDAAVANANQVFHVRDGQLTWEGGPSGGFCVDADAQATVREQMKELSPGSGRMSLKNCASKKGQRLKREDQRPDGTFLVRDLDSSSCLGTSSPPGSEARLELVACDDTQRWTEMKQRSQVKHVGTHTCLDAWDFQSAILYACHQGITQRKQMFEVVGEPGFLRLKRAVEDNGRRHFYEKCLDYAPVLKPHASIHRCSSTIARGIFWEKINVFNPPEWQLWENAEKPPAGSLPLGGEPETPEH